MRTTQGFNFRKILKSELGKQVTLFTLCTLYLLFEPWLNRNRDTLWIMTVSSRKSCLLQIYSRPDQRRPPISSA